MSTPLSEQTRRTSLNADCSRRTFLLGGIAVGAVLMAGNRFLQPTFAHAAGEGEAVSLDAVVNMTPEEMAKRSAYVMAERKTGAPSRRRASPGLAAGKDETGRARERGRRVSFSFYARRF